MKMFYRLLIVVLVLYPSYARSDEKAAAYKDKALENLREVQSQLKYYENSKNQTIPTEYSQAYDNFAVRTISLTEAAKYNNQAYDNTKGYSEIKKLEDELTDLKTYGRIVSSPRNFMRDSLYVTICNNDNTIAKAFWKELNQENDAKERYRTVLKKFKIETTNEDLKTCVKNAEFALEDIAAAAQRPQQQEQALSQQQAKGEMDNLKKENELLKKEIDLLKAENDDLKTKLQQTKKKK